MLRYWVFLFLAVVFEITGASVLNYTKDGDFQIYAYMSMIVLIGVSYYFMSLAILKISVGVAYAVWEILGLCGITFITLVIFGDSLNSQEWIGVTLAFIGIILVNLGEEKHA